MIKGSEPIMKKSKHKRKKVRRVAADYLSNISLNGSTDNEVKRAHFNKLIQNQNDCFLGFHNIHLKKELQSEYFNYYKMFVIQSNQAITNLEYFLSTEFDEFNVEDRNKDTEIYIQDVLTKNKSMRRSVPKSLPINIPVIKVLPNSPPNSAHHTEYPGENLKNRYKISSSDTEKESLQKNKYGIASTLPASSIPTDSVETTQRPEPFEKTRTTKEFSQEIPFSSAVQLNPKMIHNKNDLRRIRATSESSTESNLSSSINSNSNFITMCRHYKTYKPHLINNLRRLTTEKILLTTNNAPISVFSRLPFRSNTFKIDTLNESFKYSIQKPSQIFISDVFDLFELDFDELIKKGEMSYEILIDPTTAQILKQRNFLFKMRANEESRLKELQSDDENEDYLREKEDRKETCVNVNPIVYHPEYLDDPQLTELTAGKNRTCLKFTSYAVSIIDYVKPLELKKEINETFKEKFPYIQITLTKLRSIKREMYEIGNECLLDLIIVAQSYVYFERLIIQGLINKLNRKYLAANCLLIAAKLNDLTKKDITKLLEVITTKFRFDNKKEILSYEFSILVALEFNLIIQHEQDFISHLERIKSI